MGEGSTDTPQGVGHGGGREARHLPANHVPVLLKEAIDFLEVRRGGTYIDATVGLGGHSYEIAKRLGAAGHLIGLDKDPGALEIARERLTQSGTQGPSTTRSDSPGESERSARDDKGLGDWPEITLLHRSFAEIAKGQKAAGIDGILADIGVSSLQLDDAARGFSFQADGPLDMRMDPRSERSAEQVVNHLDERQLADVIYEFGEERRSRRIARAICRSRPIRSTAHLADVISAAARPMNQAERRIHPATRTFQALRIFVNRELDDLRALLEAAPRILKPGGRVVVISFHSLEDRIVKDAFREGAMKKYFRVLTKKPVTASEEESDRNPRARSAKLRAAEKV
ncbi:MAG TPA: 16S rRNA (cytosine(1402)-N(4))-methyltransferase RsmH [Candidatus Sulfotelmatobacter sp.]|nr:16S rRNA (cytosine(1402)-N(4))-methyltransferase RsmH [Candidatus Sulfotelmatobacter sp.]